MENSTWDSVDWTRCLLHSNAAIYEGFFCWWGPPNVWGSDFPGAELKFSIGQSPKIWCNFSNIYIKINKNLEKLLRKFQKNANFSENFLIFGRYSGKIMHICNMARKVNNFPNIFFSKSSKKNSKSSLKFAWFVVQTAKIWTHEEKFFMSAGNYPWNAAYFELIHKFL